ncbi:TPA: FIVAR domain-containing protein [Enterococcus faecalis]|nr:FIVAR domain-containing protein [Enterococcus faecalis]
MTDSQKKLLKFKKKHVLIGLFSVGILGSGIAYSAMTFNEPKNESSIEQKQEKESNKTTPAWESKVEKKEEPKKKNKTKDSLTEYVESKEEINNVTSENQTTFPSRQNLVAQLNSAIDTQEKKESKRASDQTILDSVTNSPIFKPSVPKQPELPNDKEKPTIPDDKEKPTPNPTPTPKPDPEPIPEPTPDPDPNPTPPPVVETDYSVLSTLTEQASGIELSAYLASSTEPFKLELVVSKRMLNDKNSTQEAVNLQVSRLQSAIDNLVLKGDKKLLNATYQLSLLIKTDIYTEDTVATLVTAQENAKKVLDDQEVSQQQVDEVKSHLQTAIDSLKEKEEPNLSLVYLQRLVEKATGIDTTLFTESTVTVFEGKLNEVKAYIAANNITKEDNERLLNELQQAMDQLQKKADTTKLTELLATIEGIDRTKYTEESLQLLDTKVSSVLVELENKEIPQNQVDNLYDELQQVFSQLVEKVDIPSESETSTL